MWSMFTNKVIGGFLLAFWLLLAADFLGDLLIPPPAPAHAAAKAAPEAKAPKMPAKAVAKAAPETEQGLGVLLASASAEKGKKVAKKCFACHTFEKGGKNKVGPNLFNIIGQARAAGSFNYSDALKNLGGKWSYEDLDKFLAKPKKFLPKTKMTFPGLKKAGDRAAVILYMRAFADTMAALPK